MFQTNIAIDKREFTDSNSLHIIDINCLPCINMATAHTQVFCISIKIIWLQSNSHYLLYSSLIWCLLSMCELLGWGPVSADRHQLRHLVAKVKTKGKQGWKHVIKSLVPPLFQIILILYTIYLVTLQLWL